MKKIDPKSIAAALRKSRITTTVEHKFLLGDHIDIRELLGDGTNVIVVPPGMYQLVLGRITADRNVLVISPDQIAQMISKYGRVQYKERWKMIQSISATLLESEPGIPKLYFAKELTQARLESIVSMRLGGQNVTVIDVLAPLSACKDRLPHLYEEEFLTIEEQFVRRKHTVFAPDPMISNRVFHVLYFAKTTEELLQSPQDRVRYTPFVEAFGNIKWSKK